MLRWSDVSIMLCFRTELGSDRELGGEAKYEVERDVWLLAH